MLVTLSYIIIKSNNRLPMNSIIDVTSSNFPLKIPFY